MSYTGAQILMESLKSVGVEHIFGYPGGAVIPVFDVLNKTDFKFILTRHEQAAAHAADGYARITGKPGVVIVTSGPGATNTVTGIATANMDSSPIVVITGQVKTTLIGTDAFQEVDITGIVRPITKHRYLVKNIHDLPRIIKEAFYIASTGRPGPVLIDLPIDISLGTVEKFSIPDKVNLRGYKPNYKGHPLQIKKLAQAIKEAKRPIVYVGGGVKWSGATKELREFLEKTQIPVTSTLMGLGVIDPDYKYYLDMLGMHGTVYANLSINESDLIIAIGVRFDDRVTGKVETFAPNAKIAHIDIDSASISKIIKVDIPVVGDAKQILQELNKIVEPGDYSEWQQFVLKLKEENQLDLPHGDGRLHPQWIIKRTSDLTNGEVAIATDVGQHQMWVAQYYKFKYEKQLLTSGGLGTMGSGLPFAIGAAVAQLKERKPVIVFSGDGSIQMNIQELATIKHENLPVKIFILNNSYLGMVRQWQELFWNRNYSGTFLGTGTKYYPDFVKLAESYDIPAIRVFKEEEVDDAIRKALEYDGPYLIEFVIEKEENVFPMVPAGRGLTEIMRGMA